MILEEIEHLDCAPDQAISFFDHLDENYVRWHPNHIAFRWLGPPQDPRSRFFFDQRIGGRRVRLTMRVDQSTRYQLSCTPERGVWRAIFPGMSFSFEPEGAGTLFTYRIGLQMGPLEGPLDHAVLVPIRQHMREEAESLAALTRQVVPRDSLGEASV